MNLVVPNGRPVTNSLSGREGAKVRSRPGAPRPSGPVRTRRPAPTAPSGAFRRPAAARHPDRHPDYRRDRHPDHRHGRPRAPRRTARRAAVTSVSRRHRPPGPNPAC
jgi:hypothetical protein